MQTTLYLILALAIVALVLAVRVTETPFVFLRNQLTESAANTFTDESIPLPVGVISGTSRGRFQGAELCRMHSYMHYPAMEAAQDNEADLQLTHNEVNATIGLQNPEHIWGRRISVTNLQSAVGESTIVTEHTYSEDLTVDGDGEVLYDLLVWHGIQGAGNASALASELKGRGHLIEAGAAELISALLSFGD
jgi:hypothetical protein